MTTHVEPLICALIMVSAADGRMPDRELRQIGRYITYLLQHEVGTEIYAGGPSGGGDMMMTIVTVLSDRGTTRGASCGSTRRARMRRRWR